MMKVKLLLTTVSMLEISGNTTATRKTDEVIQHELNISKVSTLHGEEVVKDLCKCQDQSNKLNTRVLYILLILNKQKELTSF